jgi:hypothetical protein
MADQREAVVGQDVGRIGGRFVRSGARAVGAQVGHDYPKAPRGDLLGMAEADPVGVGVGKEAVEQDDGPPLPQLVPGELDAVGRGELVPSRGACQRP